MKFDIERHKKNLKNREETLSREKERLQNEVNRIKRMERDFNFYQAQIELAVKEGKDGFDEEKYAIKRLCV